MVILKPLTAIDRRRQDTLFPEEQELLVCPHCGSGQSPEEEYCRHCGGKLHGPAGTAGTEQPETDAQGRILVKRPPRHKLPLPCETVEIKPPPPEMTKPEINWLSTFLPTVVTVAMAIVMAVVMKNTRMLIYTLPMTIAGVILTITNFVKSKKKYEQAVEKRETEYTAYLEKKSRELDCLLKEQLSVLVGANQKTMDCMNIVRNRTRNLWERVPEDSDFGCARIGRGSLAASFTVDAGGLRGNDPDPLMKRACALRDKYRKLPAGPISCNFFRYPVCGLAGHPADTEKLIKNILVQLTTYHSCNELKIILIGDENQMRSFQWVRDLPHAKDSSGKSTFVASTREDADDLLTYFAEQLKSREYLLKENSTYGRAPVLTPYFLFLFLQPAFLPKSHEINRFLFQSHGLGIGSVITTEEVEYLPKECQQIIRLNRDNGELYHKDNAANRQEFRMDTVSSFDFDGYGRAMRPLYFADPQSGTVIPEKYSFYEMLGIEDISQLDVGAGWASGNILKSMAVPLGIAGNKKLLNLDIFDGADGPHGLMAGMTGSGKSELLISYMLALVLRFDPNDLSFFIIDYKSGLPNQLGDLPHTVGFIRDIDVKDLDRALASVKAEVDRRKQIFDEVLSSGKNIDNYISHFKAGKVSEPIPHLVIIVDEFAELRRDKPEFIKELISLSRIGRSLGIHLILTTQNPSGVVDDDISTNSRFRICLKVQDKSVSNGFLKSPMAAYITERGRAYLQVGNNEIFELFQSGYSGGPDPAHPEQSQRTMIIDAINRHCEAIGLTSRRQLYLPALPKVLPYVADGKAAGGEGNLTVRIGTFDAPQLQSQPPAYLNVSGRNTLIVSASQYGKTNLLQTIIRSLADQYSPEEVNLYILDFNSMFLRNYAGLPHVGGVALASDTERVNNLFKMILAEIEIRKKKIVNSGLTTFHSYLEAGYKDLPHIVLMVDNYTALKEQYLENSDPLLQILRNGNAYGISAILTNAQTSGMSHHYGATLSDKIALFCNEDDQYHSLFGYTRERLEAIPGRFLMAVERDIIQGQTFLAFEGSREIDRYNKVRQFVEDCRSRYPGVSARPIPEVPQVLTMDQLYGIGRLNASDAIAIGMDYASIAPAGIDLESQFMLTLLGSDPGVKLSWVRTFLEDLRCHITERPVELFVVDSPKKDLSYCSDLPFVMKYTSNAEDLCAILEDVANTVDDRAINPARVPAQIVLIHSSKALTALSASKTYMKLYEDISRNGRGMGVFFLISDVDNINPGYGTPEILKKIRDERRALIFDSLKESKLFDIPPAQTKVFPTAPEEEDAYYLQGDKVFRIKRIRGDAQ